MITVLAMGTIGRCRVSTRHWRKDLSKLHRAEMEAANLESQAGVKHLYGGCRSTATKQGNANGGDLVSSKTLREKIVLYNTIPGCEENIDTEAACSLSDDFILPWEAQGDVASLRLKRQVFDPSHAGQAHGGGEDNNCKGDDSALSTSKKTLEKLDNLLQETKEDIKIHNPPTELTEEGHRGLYCCILHKRHILQQKLAAVTSTYGSVNTDPSFMLEEHVEEESEGNSSPELSEEES
ncbi:uncharacterized protein LOC127633391 isoform X2 [Xyrauchen texanus]|nr:uncharacterized protein LOC127633391 isoform X2 [Xyrauchen texanus]